MTPNTPGLVISAPLQGLRPVAWHRCAGSPLVMAFNANDLNPKH